MKIRYTIAAMVSIPAGLIITVLFVWLFAIDIATSDQLLGFPDGWDFMDLVANSFVVLMFGGSVRVIYRGIVDVWITHTPPGRSAG